MLALSVGLTALLFAAPAATGGGEQIVQPLVAETVRPGRPSCCSSPCGPPPRLPATPLAAPGGVFAPILGLATVAGLAYAEAVATLLPGLALEPAAFAAAAMAALFTGSVRAPLVAVVLVAELTDAYSALLAITLSPAMASLTAAALGGRPLYELLLERSLRRATVISGGWRGRAASRVAPRRQRTTAASAGRRSRQLQGWRNGNRGSPAHRRW